MSADHAYTVLPIPLEVPNVSGPTCKHCSDMRWPCRHQLFARGHRWLLNTRSDAASVSTSNMPATAHPSIPETLGCTQQPCVESFPSSPIRPWQALSLSVPVFLWRSMLRHRTLGGVMKAAVAHDAVVSPRPYRWPSSKSRGHNRSQQPPTFFADRSAKKLGTLRPPYPHRVRAWVTAGTVNFTNI